MLSNYRNIYPDSDFFAETFESQSPIALDLVQVKIYYIYGEAMLKLVDLQNLHILSIGIQKSVSNVPKAA